MQGCRYPTLNHLDRMTDSTGLIQHAIHSVPRRGSGYTTDDNARALRLCARLSDSCADERMHDRVGCYLSFMEHARCEHGGFHNFMSYQREWLDDTGCGDSQGQAVLALAEVLASDLPQGFRDLARELVDGALPVLASLTSLRAHAYVVQASALMRRAGVQHTEALEAIAREAAWKLVDAWHHSQHPDWQWFESGMTYANAVLPHAMFDAADRWPDEEFLSIAETSFRFLDRVTTAGRVFWPVGNKGWNARHGDRSLYDQQPVEASTMASAAFAALRLRYDPNDLAAFRKAHGWFVGQNSLQYPMGNSETGSCLDGLECSGVNRNQGAESTLAYLWTELLALDVQRDSRAAHVASLPLKLHQEFSHY